MYLYTFTYSYVLYGAVKSGKSTLVRIILNLCRSDQGTISVPGDYGKDVFGYMPQRLGLHPTLTIAETVRFFTAIKGLSYREISAVSGRKNGHKKSRKIISQYLQNLQQLKTALSTSDLNIKVGMLQEHQQRIVSFYIATMSCPDILIMDEPTSGCDPIYK